LEERLIGCEDPTKDDVEAIDGYEAAKKQGKLVLVPLKDLAKEKHLKLLDSLDFHGTRWQKGEE